MTTTDPTNPRHDTHPSRRLPFAKDVRRRLAAVKRGRWVRFALVSLVFFLWVIWLGNPWVLLVYPLLIDIYLTGFIPFTWWKKSKSAATRAVMSWVDAIVYALILVYFIFTFVAQNYQIPSSSLEKSLLVGDYLLVNKMAYGPRVPNTPIHFPLVQNTLPVIGTKSYIEWPQWKYHRLKGLGSVERGDIVVFNFPAGDTVALKVQNPDYYTLVQQVGRDRLYRDKETFGDIVYRPVDRRENYVKRAVGLPGDSLSIESGVVKINGAAIPQPRNVQFNHYYQLRSGEFTAADFEALGIAEDDRHRVEIRPADVPALQALGFSVLADGTVPPVYASPLTAAMVAALEQDPRVARVMLMEPEAEPWLFPQIPGEARTRADYPAVWIPKKGATIRVDEKAWRTYNRVIRNYENHPEARFENGQFYINGAPAETYTFEMDYYFMMGDNRDNSLDSRYWGFVPEDHIVGKPILVLASFDKDKSLFNGGIRWSRILTSANPDK